MAKLRSLTIHGRFAEAASFNGLIDFLRRLSADLLFDNAIQGFIYPSGEAQTVVYPIEAVGLEDIYSYAQKLFQSAQIECIETMCELDGQRCHLDVWPQGDRIVIMFPGAVRTLDDGTINFNWHYEFLVPILVRCGLKYTGIEFFEHV